MEFNVPAHTKFKRKYPRRIFYGSVGVLLHGKYFITTATTVGEGGISFLCNEKIPKESELVITFKIPGDNMISRRVEVKNERSAAEDQKSSYIIGAQFFPLTISEKRRIRSYVSSRTEEEPTI